MIKKTEWNLNESRILIPVTNSESETVTIFGKDGNCIIPSNNSNFVIGLNKTLLESHKTDLLIIQDSDLKLLSCNPDVKTQLGYSFSLIGQNDTLIKNAEQNKHKKWSHENQILEVKDILVYNKNEGVNVDCVEEPNSKLKEDALREEVVEENADESNYQLIIEYNPENYGITKEENCAIIDDTKPNGVTKKTIPEKECNDFGVHKSANKIKKKNALVENNLPLKKKAKMKETSCENQKSLLKEELLKSKNLQDKQPVPCENKHTDKGYNKNERFRISGISKKTNTEKIVSNLSEENTTIQKLECESKPEFDTTKFENILELVEGLRKFRMISVSVWQILNTGLKEMNVDILDEIVKKMDGPGGNYSPQLKAFALILYFKQPAAFNFLAKVYKNGWPSLNVIKEWKFQLNSHQRPNFVGVERNTDDIS